jgi:hypothetical protein
MFVLSIVPFSYNDRDELRFGGQLFECDGLPAVASIRREIYHRYVLNEQSTNGITPMLSLLTCSSREGTEFDHGKLVE